MLNAALNDEADKRGARNLFSVLASLCFSLSNVLEKIAVDRMPGMSPSRAMQMLNLLRNSKLWLGGFLFGAVAVALAVVAYALAPITVVQSIIAAGLVVIVAISRLVLRGKSAEENGLVSARSWSR